MMQIIFLSNFRSKVAEINRVEPRRLLFSLIERSQYAICYQWLQTDPLKDTAIKPQFIDLFMGKIQRLDFGKYRMVPLVVYRAQKPRFWAW